MKSSRNRTASIPTNRWLAYATAGATSAITCAHPHLAEATIHYSGEINRKFRFTQTSNFQLDQPGNSIHLIHFSTTNYAGHAYVGVNGGVEAAVVGFNNDCDGRFRPWAANLERGQHISFQRFVSGQSLLLTRAGPFCNGQFNRSGLGYIGFSFNNGAGDQYGWVRIQTSGNFSRTFVLRDYAYGDVGDHVRAGQTTSNEIAPAEGSLGLLALGSVGLLAWRRRRSGLLAR